MTGARRVVLLDIEGTTTSLSFVKDVLFPWSKRELPAFLASQRADARVQEALARVAETVRAEEGRELAGEHDALAVLLRYIDADRKHPGLKALQGMVWRCGWESGALRSHVYPDVRPAFERWKAEGRRLAIFSSGSVEAQQLLFRHSEAGDLSPFLDAYFDPLTAGPKREAGSYARIAAVLGVAPADVLFASDVQEELDAASAAGLATVQVLREGVLPAPGHQQVATFADAC